MEWMLASDERASHSTIQQALQSWVRLALAVRPGQSAGQRIEREKCDGVIGEKAHSVCIRV